MKEETLWKTSRLTSSDTRFLNLEKNEGGGPCGLSGLLAASSGELGMSKGWYIGW